MKRVFVFFAAIFLFQTGYAAEELPIPRFVSIKSNEANIRTGPGRRYPIKWEVTRKDIPVEILGEFEQWRKVRDISGDEGWIHQGMLSSTRFVTIQPSPLVMRRSDNASSRPVVKLEAGVSARLKTCTKEWCQVEIKDYSGWLPRSGIWGVYPDEMLK